MAILGELVEAIAFAALGHREFYEVTGRYCSYAQFQLIIQSFKDESAATWVTRRRRDRSFNALVSRGTVQVKPQETESGTVTIDESLLRAILRTRSTLSDWPRLFEAIVQFNAANSDAGRVPGFFETVALLGSLGRCLDLTHADKENHWARKFEERFAPRIPALPASISFGAAKGKDSVRMHWIRQFYRARNNHAHGGLAGGNPDWTTENHLLIAATVIPLAMKLNLRDLVGYAWTDDDHTDLDALESRIISVRTSAPALRPGERHPWASASYEVTMKAAEQALTAAFLSLRGSQNQRGPGDDE